ncbi:hypothetical protein GCM10010252_76320 [Streptomyces aureoverticillatus]|nr:hypothetical protein GCM10010252_76320 [Streptomyces aureoverticillatus]
MTTRHVVVGVDGSPDAMRALDRAAEEAARRHAALRIVTFSGLLLGSVSLRLAARTRGSLLVVRVHRSPRDAGTVLLGIESDADADATAYAFADAERRRGRLNVLHARTRGHPAPERASRVSAASPGPEEARSRFSVAGLRERYPEVGVEGRTVRAGPTHALLAATREADVVVIAAHHCPGRAGTRLGPVTRALLHHSHCPVVIVPAGQGRRPGPWRFVGRWVRSGHPWVAAARTYGW